jgi:hypothetical protein
MWEPAISFKCKAGRLLQPPRVVGWAVYVHAVEVQEFFGCRPLLPGITSLSGEVTLPTEIASVILVLVPSVECGPWCS